MFKENKKIQNQIRLLLMIGLGLAFAWIFYPFIVPLLLAIFVSFGLEVYLKKIKLRTKHRKYLTGGLVLILILAFLIPFAAFSARIVKSLKTLNMETLQNSQFVQSGLNLWEQIQSLSQRVSENFGMDQSFLPNKEDLLSNSSPVILEKATEFLKSLPDLGLSLFIFFCFLYVFTTRAQLIYRWFEDLQFLPSDEMNEITQSLQNSCSLILVSTMFIGAVQALIVSVGSLIFGFHEFFLIFTLTLVLSFIPVIGAAPVAFVLALIAFMSSASGNGIGLLVIGLIAGSIDNILKPYIFSKTDENMNPVISLIGLIGAIIAFGLPGLLLGPLILQVTLKLYPTLMKHFFEKSTKT